jgi:8-oxo-dGTP pyrophosphatase MutT (NUDIX family)
MALSLDSADLLGKLRQRLAEPLPRQLPLEGNRPSAVLLPILARPQGPALLMVRKSDQLRKHAGQVAFPGGALDPGEDATAAAMREAEEEIGLEPQRVELLGSLDDERTFVSDFHIRPLVGWVAEPPAGWQLDPGEIVGVLEIGLQELMDTEPCSWLEFTALKRTWRIPRWEFGGDRVVWGASARILLGFRERLLRA